ncbi:MAG: UPF0182 family protein, partial [Pyrinomonadaceae bacterium]
MSRPFRPSDDEIIDVPPPKRRRWKRWLIGGVILFFIALSQSLSIYVSALWFGSLGYSAIYWYILRQKVALFLAFFLVTVLILRAAFWLLERVFAAHGFETRTIVVNNQPIEFSPGSFMRPVAWAFALVFGLFYAFAMKDKWQQFALYTNQAATASFDPIFQKPLGFYLFTLPVYDSISSWLIALTFVVLCATLVYSFLTLPQKVLKSARSLPSGKPLMAISSALAALMLALAWRAYLSRFPYLWNDHQVFSGVTYTEANYLLPSLRLVSFALIAAAAISLLNAFTKRSLRLLMIAISIPMLVYIGGVVIVPAYVNSFIVKPNELARETPYIEHNISWTRRAFGLDQLEQREFEAENSVAALDLNANRATLE